MTPALRAGAGKASRRGLYLTLVRTATVNLFGGILERFAHKAAISNSGGAMQR